MLEFTCIVGHLLATKPVIDTLPRDVHVMMLATELCRRFTTDIFVLDFWPFSRIFLVVSSPSTATQVIQKHSLPKPALLHDYFLLITGGPNFFTMFEEQWKPWREIFNPGFSASYILEQVSHIVQVILISVID
jgi:cytochrome P450